MKKPEDYLMAKAFNLSSDLVPKSRIYLEMVCFPKIEHTITAMTPLGGIIISLNQNSEKSGWGKNE